MPYITRYLAISLLVVVWMGGMPSSAQSIVKDMISERTNNRHVQTDFTSVAIVENADPSLDEAALAVSYVGGSWNILIESVALDWALARAEHVVFRIDGSTYETSDIHTTDAERAPNRTKEENSILMSSELQALVAEASHVEASVGAYVLDLSVLRDHYALVQSVLENDGPESGLAEDPQ